MKLEVEMGSSKKDAESDGSSDSSMSDDGECSTDDEKHSDCRRSRSRSPKQRRSKRSPGRSRSRDRQSRSRSRSRSFERRRSSRREYRRFRSRSRSPRTPPSRGNRYRSRSPRRYERERNMGSRENPSPSRCLGVFGMNLHTSERDLRDFFDRFGPIEDVQVVYDQATRMSRGFGFVYFECVEDAIEAKNRATGTEIDGRNVRIDFSFTKRPHTPTPGIYMGNRASASVSRNRQYSGERNGSYHGGGNRADGRYWYKGGGRRGEWPNGGRDDDRRRRSRSVERDIY